MVYTQVSRVKHRYNRKAKPPSMIDPYELMASRGISLRERSIQQRQAGRITSNGIGGRMLREGAAPFLFAMKKWMGGGPRTHPSPNRVRVLQLIETVGLEACVAKTLQHLIDITATGSASDCSLHRLRTGLGRELAEDAAWRNFKKNDSVGFSYRIKDYQRATGAAKAALHRNMEARMSAEGSPLDWDAADRLMLSAVLINNAVKFSGLFTTVRRSSKNKNGVQVVQSPLSCTFKRT